MRKKVLTPTTIIPPDLYVERAADRQLRAIVEDMGRPGYVLVARQMGKTNLLINMKRERKQDIVLYLDLSTRFGSSRAWFRNVIDAMLEAYPTYLDRCRAEIHEQRDKFRLEPNVEFDRHIRLLLREVSQRVIIVLDEIDSLVNAPYSDSILAQIRSMYFSRVNYPEYSRLTYVLSGVAEPVDLIKDKNISPFNIGEKIYLDDFSREEFETFLQRASLQLSTPVSDSIFAWVRGNPRMTWDLCSLVEDRVLIGDEIGACDVDEMVQHLYLTSFDRAPVDHIRTLVESDSQVRNAIVSIRYGKGEFLDDRTRNRLYLAGITAAASSRDLSIKNRVVDAALSETWLNQIEGVRKATLISAIQSFDDEQYDEAIAQFEQVLLSNREDLKPHHKIQLAIARYYVGQSSKAIQELHDCEVETTDAGVLQTIHYYLGVAHIAEKSNSEALDYLQRVIVGPDELLRIRGKLSALAAHLQAGGDDRAETAFDLSHEVISDLEKRGDSDPSLLTQALFNQSSILRLLGRKDDANSSLARALQISKESVQPALLIAQYELSDEKSERKALVEKAANRVLASKLRTVNLAVTTLELTKDKLAKLLARLRIHDANDLYETLLEYTVQRVYSNRDTKFGVILDLFDSLASDEDRRSCASLLEKGFVEHLNESVSQAEQLRALRYLALFVSQHSYRSWLTRYLTKLSTDVAVDGIDDLDIYAMVHLMLRSGRSDDDLEMLQIFEAHQKFETQVAVRVPLMNLFFLYQRLRFHDNHEEPEVAREVGRRLLEILDNDKEGELSKEAAAIIPDIRSRASRLFAPVGRQGNPFRRIGRNQIVIVQYGDAAPVKSKFKFVELDLRAEKCKLIRVDSKLNRANR